LGAEDALTLPDGQELDPGIKPVIVTPDYYIGVERYETTTYMHGSVFAPWSPRLAREVRSKVDAIVASHGGPVFVASHQPHNGDHVKFGKFARLMGFSFFRTVRGTDGADHAVFVRWS
jgi:hypothetical protein